MAQAFLHGTGGSNPLNFKVVASTTEPSNPKENTIWVKPGIPIGYWTTNKDSNAPAYTASQGTVVFWWEAASEAEVSGTDSPGFMPIKYKATNPPGYMRLKPTYCYQNTDGTSSGWKKLNAFIYKFGSWVQFSMEFAATITVTYPEGSTCTCTDGKTTLTAPDTTGKCTFTVPNSGTWKVTCTNDNQTKSSEVSITTNGQSASVTLAYITYFFKNGDKCTAVTGGWSAGTASDGFTAGDPSIGSAKITCYSSGASIVTSAATKNKVDLTNISKLTIVSPGGSTANNGYYGYFCVRSSRNGVGNSVAQVMIPKGAATVTLDVSGLSGSYYLMLRIQAGASGGDQVDMSECYGT